MTEQEQSEINAKTIKYLLEELERKNNTINGLYDFIGRLRKDGMISDGFYGDIKQ